VPCPFPGMDPYLENPKIWREAHHWFISATGEQLQPQLNKRGYYVSVESRIWVARPERLVIPDVALLTPQKTHATADETSTGTLVADEPVRLRGLATEVREDYLQIYEKETGELITGIEFISPSNKSDHKARRLYVSKRKALEAAEINIVEIDLLRDGKALVRLPKALLATIQPQKYVINVFRGDSLDYEFYPVELRSRLPRVGIPLKSGERDVVLDIQAAFERVYELGAFLMRIDYNQDPVPALAEEDSKWAAERLIERGVRTRH
jgi:hypothetical protein